MFHPAISLRSFPDRGAIRSGASCARRVGASLSRAYKSTGATSRSSHRPICPPPRPRRFLRESRRGPSPHPTSSRLLFGESHISHSLALEEGPACGATCARRRAVRFRARTCAVVAAPWPTPMNTAWCTRCESGHLHALVGAAVVTDFEIAMLSVRHDGCSGPTCPSGSSSGRRPTCAEQAPEIRRSPPRRY